ncbi:hypothetical protein PHLCEN_2v4903 [Hermanssonia centrifuga]|uniref:Uncharacterized protein n=1 Tax=Hermanssonia centrifuga TaxID=98765 RepID=A0A2R6PGM2_9APHY|nr:hypothetical protein PHLCEN_2v4903 [Hermanssonia centrifuga]
MQPPLYHYGWEIDWKKFAKYAEDNDLRAYVRQEDDEDDEDDDEEDEETEPNFVLTYDESLTVLKVLGTLARDVGIRRLPSECALASVLGRGTIVPFFALYSNYQLAEAPSRAQLLVLQDHLRARIGETESPKWLPDYDFRWRRRCWQ